MTLTAFPARGFLAATGLLCLLAPPLHGNGFPPTATRTAYVEHMASETAEARPIKEAMATLVTNKRGAVMRLRTSELEPGHVTTAWWVIINAPWACTSSPCSAEDVIGRAEQVRTQIVYADGTVNKSDGTAEFSANLQSGRIPQGWFDQGFDSPETAEIHLVLNDHGPLIPEIAASMLTSYRGGCSDESLPPPFPARAKTDGIAGPNTCVLIQDAIFKPARKVRN
ncbi:hypothetical protein ACOTTU_17635 [Roseobacter sp. EG26]|uniref:hypothetical protein n=1 Tax=Roseobacter sp. EG26 TaxID=3412477 RepID=UPI003CE517E7